MKQLIKINFLIYILLAGVFIALTSNCNKNNNEVDIFPETPKHKLETLKVLSYNIYVGFQNDKFTQNKYVDWVKRLNPDVVAYQEMNHFSQTSLEEFAQEYDHTYAVFAPTRICPVALSSIYPIVNVQKVDDNMHHTYLYANIKGIHFFVIHFSPYHYSKRVQEVRQVLDHAALIPKTEKILIMGDFNSLDRSDNLAHKHHELGGTPNYKVTDMIKNEGFVDTFWKVNTESKVSLPTKIKDNPGKRYDYMWANATMAKHVVKAEIIHDKTTHVISDHYPVYVEFEFK